MTNRQITILSVLILMPVQAWAYLDPGTGSMLLQVILGGVAAVGVALKLFWYQIAGFFGFRRKASTEDEAD